MPRSKCSASVRKARPCRYRLAGVLLDPSIVAGDSVAARVCALYAFTQNIDALDRRTVLAETGRIVTSVPIAQVFRFFDKLAGRG